MRRIAQASLAAGGLLTLAVAGILAAGPVIAASPIVESAIKSLGKIEADATKFQAFCKLMKDMGDVQDAAKAQALEAQLHSLLKSIGPDVYEAWDLSSDLDRESEDGKAYDAAVEAIDNKCPD